ESALAPAVETFSEGPDARDALASQPQGHLGGRGFVGAATEEDDVAVARDSLDGFLEIRGIHTHRAGNRFRLGVKFHLVAQVHDNDLFTRIETLFQFLRRDARDAKLPDKSPAVLPFPTDIGGKRRYQQNQKAPATKTLEGESQLR